MSNPFIQVLAYLDNPTKDNVTKAARLTRLSKKSIPPTHIEIWSFVHQALGSLKSMDDKDFRRDIKTSLGRIKRKAEKLASFKMIDPSSKEMAKIIQEEKVFVPPSGTKVSGFAELSQHVKTIQKEVLIPKQITSPELAGAFKSQQEIMDMQLFRDRMESFKRKLKKVIEGSIPRIGYEAFSLPLLVVTENPVSENRLENLGMNYTLLENYLILEEQYVVRVSNDIKSNAEKLKKVLSSLMKNSTSSVEYVNALTGDQSSQESFSYPGIDGTFFWLVPRSKMTRLSRISFLNVSFPINLKPKPLLKRQQLGLRDRREKFETRLEKVVAPINKDIQDLMEQELSPWKVSLAPTQKTANGQATSSASILLKDMQMSVAEVKVILSDIEKQIEAAKNTKNANEVLRLRAEKIKQEAILGEKKKALDALVKALDEQKRKIAFHQKKIEQEAVTLKRKMK